MAEQQEQQNEKPKLPVTGLFALVAIVSSLLIYQEISLQTSRPITKGPAHGMLPEKGTVLSRLWQDPFEAVEAHQLSEKNKEASTKKDGLHQLKKLADTLGPGGISSGLRILTVFLDGSPYSSGTETRLNDRYAIVSALGAAGYVPESGEYIRLFRWEHRRTSATDKADLIIPFELFIPRARASDPHVLVLWLRDQDFSPNPLACLNDLLAALNKQLTGTRPGIKPMHSVLGPRFSTSLSAMLKEIKTKSQQPGGQCPLFDTLKDVHFYSPWATAGDPFLLDKPAGSTISETLSALPKICDREEKVSYSDRTRADRVVEQFFRSAGIRRFTRTINTDAVLAKELVKELRRRNADFTRCEKDKDGCGYRVALISEWDTLYGRALPLTFAAVAMTGSTSDAKLEPVIDQLRKGDWPEWISRHSYLRGLDGELPTKEDAKESEKQSEESRAKSNPWYKSLSPDIEQAGGPRPEGRSQLDYVIRLAESLKREEARTGKEFRAIGVLGSDVYDKLLILQALRRTFPYVLFFTTDLNARLSYPTQWEWTRNLIISSNFGLDLQPDLQRSIPPFRDNYQTSLFYSTFLALQHLVPAKEYCPGCVKLEQRDSNGKPQEILPELHYRNTGPRLYEIGWQGPFDISTDPVSMQADPAPAGHESIHPARPDIAAFENGRRMRELAGKTAAAAVILFLASMLISSTVAHAAVSFLRTRAFLITLTATLISAWLLVEWMASTMPDLAQSEPFTLTDGISAWPTAVIRLLALVTSVFFLWLIWRKMEHNDEVITRKFDLENGNGYPANSVASKAGHSPAPLARWKRTMRACLGVHLWHPQSAPEVAAAQLWNEYRELGQVKNFFARGIPQVFVALCVAAVIMMLFGLPNTPCRGSACFDINNGLIFLGVATMMMLIFYVVDATRLCRRWINRIALNRVRWSDSTRSRLASENGVRQEHLDEWLGIELIADRTTVIGNFIYYPFIVMFLIGIARHPYLDNWGFPISLVIIFALNAALVFINGMALRRSANIAKRQAITRLETRLIHLSDQKPDEARQKQQIEWSLRAIRNNRRGAFLPFTEHPVFGAAIALPSGGYGLVLLFEYLATGL